MVYTHYRENRIFVGRFKNVRNWVTGSDSRGEHETDGKAGRRAAIPAVGPCVKGIHSGVEEPGEWAETWLSATLEIRWKRKDERGIRQFWMGFRKEDASAKGQRGITAHRIQNQKISKYICKWGIITESECFYWGPIVTSALGPQSSLVYQWPRRK